jgi:hypothetical protein
MSRVLQVYQTLQLEIFVLKSCCFYVILRDIHRFVSGTKMAIRLETSKRTGINNYQGTDISSIHLNWAKDLRKTFPQAIPRTSPSPLYNCHGLTFASRRTRIEKSIDVQTILSDDNYKEMEMKDVLPGDIVLYYSDNGDPSHSGVVVEYKTPLLVPIIYSKWGNAGEFIHPLRHCPDLYGVNYKFYRCLL